jgi:hypothetical protein
MKAVKAVQQIFLTLSFLTALSGLLATLAVNSILMKKNRDIAVDAQAHTSALLQLKEAMAYLDSFSRVFETAVQELDKELLMSIESDNGYIALTNILREVEGMEILKAQETGGLTEEFHAYVRVAAKVSERMINEDLGLPSDPSNGDVREMIGKLIELRDRVNTLIRRGEDSTRQDFKGLRDAQQYVTRALSVIVVCAFFLSLSLLCVSFVCWLIVWRAGSEASP